LSFRIHGFRVILLQSTIQSSAADTEQFRGTALVAVHAFQHLVQPRYRVVGEILAEPLAPDALRYRDEFPDGVNVNFVEKQQDGALRQRTYERGVENLTRACGTGATAIASVLMKRGVVDPPVELVVDGGRLMIAVENNEYWLSGDARVIYTGVLDPEAFDW
jgi:diaminopimelate epimerase